MAFGYRGPVAWLQKHPTLGTGDGLTYGYAIVPGPCNQSLAVIFAGDYDGVSDGWEHVSVSSRNRPPNWREMCFVKDLFWGDGDTVLQFHPPKTSYVNDHPNCLHLWRHRDRPVALPPTYLV